MLTCVIAACNSILALELANPWSVGEHQTTSCERGEFVLETQNRIVVGGASSRHGFPLGLAKISSRDTERAW